MDYLVWVGIGLILAIESDVLLRLLTARCKHCGVLRWRGNVKSRTHERDEGMIAVVGCHKCFAGDMRFMNRLLRKLNYQDSECEPYDE